MPASDRFTTSTWAACASGDRLRCSTPSPPARAIAMAIRDSVTVSIGDDTSGTLIRTRRVTWVLVSTALGTTSDSAGSSSTSSKVRPEHRELRRQAGDLARHRGHPVILGHPVTIVLRMHGATSAVHRIRAARPPVRGSASAAGTGRRSTVEGRVT